MVSYWRSSCSIFRLRLCPQTLCIFESHIIDPWSRQFMPAVRPRVTPRYSVWEGAVRMFGSGFAEFMARWDCTPVTPGPTLITLPFGEATITRRRDASARRLLPQPDDQVTLGTEPASGPAWVPGTSHSEAPPPPPPPRLLSSARTLNYARAVREHGTGRGI